MNRRSFFATLFSAPLVALKLRRRDDSAFLQRLLDHPDRAGRVVFPRGTYDLSRMLHIGLSVRHLSARGAILRQPTDMMWAISVRCRVHGQGLGIDELCIQNAGVPFALWQPNAASVTVDDKGRVIGIQESRT